MWGLKSSPHKSQRSIKENKKKSEIAVRTCGQQSFVLSQKNKGKPLVPNSSKPTTATGLINPQKRQHQKSNLRLTAVKTNRNKGSQQSEGLQSQLIEGEKVKISIIREYFNPHVQIVRIPPLHLWASELTDIVMVEGSSLKQERGKVSLSYSIIPNLVNFGTVHNPKYRPRPKISQKIILICSLITASPIERPRSQKSFPAQQFRSDGQWAPPSLSRSEGKNSLNCCLRGDDISADVSLMPSM